VIEQKEQAAMEMRLYRPDNHHQPVLVVSEFHVHPDHPVLKDCQAKKANPVWPDKMVNRVWMALM